MAARKKSNTQLRDDMRNELKLAVADKGHVLTDDLKAKIEVKVMEAFPYQRDEFPGWTTTVILTFEEIVALAVSVGLCAPDNAQTTVNVLTNDKGGFVNQYPFKDKKAGSQDGDITALMAIGDGTRESVIRTTEGTDWSKYGAVFLFRPARETKKDDTKDVLDEILG